MKQQRETQGDKRERELYAISITFAARAAMESGTDVPHAQTVKVLAETFGKAQIQVIGEIGRWVRNVRALEEIPSGREVVTVGWDGASKPMLRYADELGLSDHERSIVSAADRKAAAR